MPILLSCACGKKFRVNDNLAGKRIKCPGCAAVLAVPGAATPEAAHGPAEEKVTATKGPRKAERPPAPEPEPQGHDRAANEGGEAVRRRPRRADSPTPFWVHGNDLLVLSDDALHLASPDEKGMSRATAALESGEPADSVLGDDATVIALDSIVKVEGNLHHTFFTVHFAETPGAEPTEKNVFCAGAGSRDEVLAALRERLGPDWKRQVVQYSRLRASVEPLIVIGLFGFLTFCFYMAGAYPESDQSGGGTKVVRTNWVGLIFVWVYNLLGPWGGVSVGGVVVALGVAWLVARVIKPPLMLTLTPPGAAPRGKKRPKGR
jgi:hypothetical protein